MNEFIFLTAFVVFTAFIHTLIGADHYLPLIALTKLNHWPKKYAFWVTLLCGLFHLLSSLIIVFIGIRFSGLFSRMEIFNHYRGEIAAWLIISMGLVYFIRGMKSVFAKKAVPEQWNFNKGKILLYVFFILGPCEPLMAILLHPSLINNMMVSAWLVGVFSVVTIITMESIVLILSFQLTFKRHGNGQKYAPVLSGLVLILCGLGIKYLGL